MRAYWITQRTPLHTLEQLRWEQNLKKQNCAGVYVGEAIAIEFKQIQTIYSNFYKMSKIVHHLWCTRKNYIPKERN